MDKQKRISIQIRIDEQQKKDFDTYCKELGTTMSDELKRYIVSCNKNFNKDK